ncbi:MAG: membrane protein insertion efficiency factor YidD [Myxococcota bacterium]
MEAKKPHDVKIASRKTAGVTRFVLWAIQLYQRFISPVKPACCRFYPSCSAYARQVIAQHGLLHGGWLSIKRIGRCHPFHPGGVDLPPPG